MLLITYPHEVSFLLQTQDIVDLIKLKKNELDY
jgi:hypothetical protein